MMYWMIVSLWLGDARQGGDLGRRFMMLALAAKTVSWMSSEYPGAFVHAQPGGMSTQTVVAVDTSEMPNAFSSTTLYWPAECLIDCAGK
jgi:hypothetical protein